MVQQIAMGISREEQGQVVIYTITSLTIASLSAWNEAIITHLRSLPPTQTHYLALHDLSSGGVSLPFLVLNNYKVFNVGVSPLGQRQVAKIFQDRPTLQTRLALVLSTTISGQMTVRRGRDPEMDIPNFEYKVCYERQAALDWLSSFITESKDETSTEPKHE